MFWVYNFLNELEIIFLLCLISASPWFWIKGNKLKCQILSCNSNRSSIISSIISTFGSLPLLNSKLSTNHTESWDKQNVMSCYPFTLGRGHPHCLQDYHSRQNSNQNYIRKRKNFNEHFDCFFSLFDSAKMMRWRQERKDAALNFSAQVVAV